LELSLFHLRTLETMLGVLEPFATSPNKRCIPFGREKVVTLLSHFGDRKVVKRSVTVGRFLERLEQINSHQTFKIGSKTSLENRT
jgi:hypothetical protein